MDTAEDRKAVFLVVADETEEFETALEYVCKVAKNARAKVAILRVMDEEDFQIWGNVQDKIHDENRREAEGLLDALGSKVQELCYDTPVLYLREGEQSEAVIDVIESDRNIARLILASSSRVGDPGPLISYFTTKGIEKLPVPLVVIPPEMDIERVRV